MIYDQRLLPAAPRIVVIVSDWQDSFSAAKLEAQPLEPNDYLRHPAFDMLLPLAALGGPIERITALLNPMTQRGGQGLIDLKFEHAARYGLLELSHAPRNGPAYA
ncbi:MAG: hypothetical protein P9M14_18455 [Candidatus Alcyoniella australis]|nr:hypothetical protein [Candidatus Alcyoniella australis]